jgi:hypothetical protein
MGLNKLQGHGMNVLGIFLLKMVLGLVRQILHSSLEMGKDLFVCQIYVNDIIFCSANKSFRDEFSNIMTDRFDMSMMGELKYFFGFQIKQLEDGTFISQTKYTHDLVKKFGKDKAKPIKTPMGTNSHLDLDMGSKSVDQKVYCSMIGSLFYLCASMPDIMLSLCVCKISSHTQRMSFKGC